MFSRLKWMITFSAWIERRRKNYNFHFFWVERRLMSKMNLYDALPRSSPKMKEKATTEGGRKWDWNWRGNAYIFFGFEWMENVIRYVCLCNKEAKWKLKYFCSNKHQLLMKGMNLWEHFMPLLYLFFSLFPRRSASIMLCLCTLPHRYTMRLLKYVLLLIRH